MKFVPGDIVYTALDDGAWYIDLILSRSARNFLRYFTLATRASEREDIGWAIGSLHEGWFDGSHFIAHVNVDSIDAI